MGGEWKMGQDLALMLAPNPIPRQSGAVPGCLNLHHLLRYTDLSNPIRTVDGPVQNVF